MEDDVSQNDIVTHGTLALLETRLRRLEFLLTGNAEEGGQLGMPSMPANKETIQTRMAALEAHLGELKRLDGPAGGIIRGVELLYSKYPELFSMTSIDAQPRSEDLSTLAAVVLAHASLYPETASRLSSLKTLQIPSAAQSAMLIELQARLEECQKTEDNVEADLRLLRERSAKCLEWWVTIGVVGVGDMWDDWEHRVRDVETALIRYERRLKEEQGYL